MRRRVLLVALIGWALASYRMPAQSAGNVTRMTLDNGLRIVVVRDPLAPVVTVQENYLAGENETPAESPGLAHAQEHMAFRGCAGLSGDQIAALYAQLGGQNNADTQQNITQYFATIPAANLEVALHIDAACMQDIGDREEDWAQERGAIEQEVARDLSNPTYKFLTRLNEDLFSGTPYAHDALGTKESFDKLTGAALKKFFREWYAPNNAILVITGNVDPSTTAAKVKQIYRAIPKRAVPPKPEVKLKPVHAETFTLESNLPYTLLFIAYRLPGSSSKDYAAVRVMSDVLASERGDFYALVPKGEALAAEFALAETYPAASVGFAAVALPAGADATAMAAKVQTIIKGYVTKGFPAELVESAKRSEISSAEFERNSIPGLAQNWSQALAAEGRNSPDEDLAAIRQVVPEAVDRVARGYLLSQSAIVATLVPVPSGKAVPTSGFGGVEKLTSTPSKPVALPEWAEAELAKLALPQWDLHPADLKLGNGIRLIVQTEKISQTVTVLGEIRNEPKLETPPGKDGVADVLEQLFPFGTKTMDRLALRKALDDLGARETAGASFSMHALKSNFSRAMQILAENELNPALPEEAFKVVQEQTAELAAGQLTSPGYRMQRALEMALLPKGDPGLRETTPDTVRAVTLEDVKAYYAKVFRPDLTAIVVVGDITAEEAKAEVEKYFGAWKASGPAPEVTLPAVPPNKAASVFVPDPARIQSSVALAEELGLNRYNPDYYPLQLGNHVLGGGFYATRLYRDLRQTTGLVYNVDDSVSASRTRGVYTVTYACDPQNVTKARALAQRDLEEMQKENVSPGELHQAKALLLRQIPLAESSSDAVGEGMLGRAQMDLPLDEPIRAARNYFEMTADQVRTAFAKWVRIGDLVQVVRGPQ